MGNSTLPLGGGDTARLSEIILQPGHTFVPGDVVRADDTTPGKFVFAQADTAANAEAVGIVESVAGSSFEVVYQGRVDLQGVAWADLPFVTIGEVWFLSGTVAGELTRTPPTTAGSVIKAMLVVTDPGGGSEEGILTGYVGVQIGGESLVSLNDIQPTGSILPWAAPALEPVPNGWLVCDGSILNQTDYPELFVVISDTYNTGGESPTEFRLPDLRGRAAIGLGGVAAGVLTGNDDAGDSGGEEDHILTAGEVPDHDHVHDTVATFIAPPAAPYVALTLPPSGPGPGPTPVGPGSLPPNAPHNNMQPFLVVNFIIRATAQASAALLEHGIGGHFDVDPDASPLGLPSDPDDCDVLKFNATPVLPDFPNGRWEAAPSPGAGPGGSAVFSFRNKIINGQFPVWQRGAAFSANGYTSDRWRIGAVPDGGVGTTVVTQQTFALGQTDVPGFANRYFDFQASVAGGGAFAGAGLVQRIESVRTFNGSDITVSFWAMGSIAGTVAVSLLQFFGSGGAPSLDVIPLGQEISLTTSWQFFSLTFAMPTIAGKTLGTNKDDSLHLRFLTYSNASNATAENLPNTLSYTGTVSLSNVQAEEGSTATAFEIRELATEIALCQRYFCKAHDMDTAPFNMSAQPGVLDNSQDNTPGIYEVHGSPLSGGQGGTEHWPVRMRAAPTVLVVQVAPSLGPSALETMLLTFIGEGSMSILSPSNTILSFLWTADAEL